MNQSLVWVWIFNFRVITGIDIVAGEGVMGPDFSYVCSLFIPLTDCFVAQGVIS